MPFPVLNDNGIVEIRDAEGRRAELWSVQFDVEAGKKDELGGFIESFCRMGSSGSYGSWRASGAPLSSSSSIALATASTGAIPSTGFSNDLPA